MHNDTLHVTDGKYTVEVQFLDEHIPKADIKALASFLLPKIQEYFESDEGRREFEEWKQQRSLSDIKK